MRMIDRATAHQRQNASLGSRGSRLRAPLSGMCVSTIRSATLIVSNCLIHVTAAVFTHFAQQSCIVALAASMSGDNVTGKIVKLRRASALHKQG